VTRWIKPVGCVQCIHDTFLRSAPPPAWCYPGQAVISSLLLHSCIPSCMVPRGCCNLPDCGLQGTWLKHNQLLYSHRATPSVVSEL